MKISHEKINNLRYELYCYEHDFITLDIGTVNITDKFVDTIATYASFNYATDFNELPDNYLTEILSYLKFQFNVDLVIFDIRNDCYEQFGYLFVDLTLPITNTEYQSTNGSRMHIITVDLKPLKP